MSTLDEIEKIWFRDSIGNQNEYTVGVNALSIKEYRARGEGDKWYWEVETTEKSITIFNPEVVTRKQLKENK